MWFLINDGMVHNAVGESVKAQIGYSFYSTASKTSDSDFVTFPSVAFIARRRKNKANIGQSITIDLFSS